MSFTDFLLKAKIILPQFAWRHKNWWRTNSLLWRHFPNTAFVRCGNLPAFWFSRWGGNNRSFSPSLPSRVPRRGQCQFYVLELSPFVNKETWVGRRKKMPIFTLSRYFFYKLFFHFFFHKIVSFCNNATIYRDILCTFFLSLSLIRADSRIGEIILYDNCQACFSFQVLDLTSLKTHHWYILPCSAVTGENLVSGIDWLLKDISARIFTLEWQEYIKLVPFY